MIASMTTTKRGSSPTRNERGAVRCLAGWVSAVEVTLNLSAQRSKVIIQTGKARAMNQNSLIIGVVVRLGDLAAPKILPLVLLPFGSDTVRESCRARPNLTTLPIIWLFMMPRF